MSSNNNKIIFCFSILLLIVGTFTINDSFAASHDVPELFIEIPENELFSQIQTPSAFDPITIQAKNILVNTSVLDGDEFSITAFGDTFTVTKYKTSTNDSQTVWWGNDKDGNETNLIIDGDIIFGTITTAEKTYYLDADEITLIHTFTELDLSLLPNEHGDGFEAEFGEAGLFDYDLLPAETQLEITTFTNSFIGDHDYQADGVTLTVDVAIGYTEAAKDNDRRIAQKIGNAINNANRVYNNNELPIQLNIENNREVRGYVEEVDGRNASLYYDMINLRNDRFAINAADLDGLRGSGLRDQVDIVLLIVHPAAGDSVNACGIAGSILADDIANSVAVVKDSCLSGHSLTHEIGHLQGAHHNPEAPHARDDNPFQYQHGYFDPNSGVRQRTIMSYDNAACDPFRQGFSCLRADIFSDPNRNFRGTVAAAGTEADNFNAKVLYGTAQHIASLRGGEQTFDTVRPQGAFAWVGEFIDKIFNQGDTMDISATFTEPLHDNHPPTVTISDGTTTTPIVMSKSSNTVYTATHLLTNEVGSVTLEFSGAKDIFNNDIITAATAGGSVTVIIPDTEKPVITLQGVTPVDVIQGDTYTDAGATCNDVKDGSIPVIVGGLPFDTSILGANIVTYDCKDIAENDADQVIRTVNVVLQPIVTLEIKVAAYGATSPITFNFEIITDNIVVDTKQVSADTSAYNRMDGTTGIFELEIIPSNTYAIAATPPVGFKIMEYYGQEMIYCAVGDGDEKLVGMLEIDGYFTGVDSDPITSIVCGFVFVPFQ